MNGFNQGILMLKNICSSNTNKVALFQEHWLNSDQLSYFDAFKNEFDSEGIIEKIKEIQSKWKNKYPNLDFKTQNLRFDNLVNFDYTFVTEIQYLNMDANK